MTWRTHVPFGISTRWLLAPLPPEIVQDKMGVLAAAAAPGALIPDLDSSESKIKHLKMPNTHIKPFMLPALIVNRSDQHRGLLHSLTGFGMITRFVVPTIFFVEWGSSCCGLSAGLREPSCC